MEKNICGYLVVRKSSLNYDELGRGGCFLPSPPIVGEIFYGGIDRMEWVDIYDDFYAKKPLTEMENIYNMLEVQKKQREPILLLKDSLAAIKYYKYYAEKNKGIDLIAVYSDKIAKKNGIIDNEFGLKHLGIDLFVDGYGSYLREGLFKRPDLFDELFIDSLNTNGIFDDNDDLIDKYISYYNNLTKTHDCLEIFPQNDSLFYKMQVYLVNLSKIKLT